MGYLITNFKGKYRILPEIDQSTFDFPKTPEGGYEESDLYIPCKAGDKICYFGHGVLIACVSSLLRGRRVAKILRETGVSLTNYMESDKEVEFRFKAKDMDAVAELLKAKTYGANISPFSSKNLPKSDISIPIEEMAKYKAIIAQIKEGDFLLMRGWINEFLDSELTKRYRHTDKKFDYRSDMKMKKMSRQTKEYIYDSGMWQEYLNFLQKKIEEHYKED